MDTIPEPGVYELYYFDVTRDVSSPNEIKIEIYTDYEYQNTNVIPTAFPTADVLFSVMGVDYGIAMTTHGNVTAGNVYKANENVVTINTGGADQWDTSLDIYGSNAHGSWIIGGYQDNCSGADCTTGTEVPVRMDSTVTGADLVGMATAFAPQSGATGTPAYVNTIMLSDIETAPGSGSHIDFTKGITFQIAAAWCGNDVMNASIPELTSESPVPVPAALPLLASAVAGLGFVGYRRNRAS